MRENCTYGSMRGRAYPITRGVPLDSTTKSRGVAMTTFVTGGNVRLSRPIPSVVQFSYIIISEN